MPVGNLLDHFRAEPFPEFHYTLLMTGRTKMAALAGKGQEVLVVAVFALHACEAVVQISAIQIPVDDLLDIGAKKSILPFKPLLIDLEKGFKMILHAPVIIGRLWIPWTVNGGGSGHDFSPLRKSDRHIIERAFYLSRGKFSDAFSRLAQEEIPILIDHFLNLVKILFGKMPEPALELEILPHEIFPGFVIDGVVDREVEGTLLR
jgi:hypothetical protein